MLRSYVRGDQRGCVPERGRSSCCQAAWSVHTTGLDREFRFGQIRQLDAVASRTLVNLASASPLLQVRDGERVMVDLDDTIIEVHGYQKRGASFGYTGVRGLNALIATASTTTSAPVILARRLRKGKTGSPKGAARIVADTLATLRRTTPESTVRPLLRADSAVKAAIATIPDDGWETIEYTDAIRDEATGRWISKAEVAEVTFTALRSRKIAERVEGRLVVRRIPDLNPNKVEQPTLFDVYRHHAFFTTTDKQSMGTVAADKTHRAHAIIEQVHADLKSGPLAHLPSGVFTANSAWLVLAVIAFNLTRAAALIADRAGRLARATTGTVRRTLIAVPARLARSARRIILHLPEAWPWQAAFDRLFRAAHAPPPTRAS